jgi:lipopolysaccharide biosynthesis glycosyltransferase
LDFTTLIQNSVKKHTEFFNHNKTSFAKEINIGFGGDAAFIRPMGVAITSLAVNNPDIFLNVYVFLSSSSEEDLVKLEQMPQKYPNIKLTLYEVDENNLNKLPILLHLSLAMYFRLLMPIILCELDTILYLDADIICLKNIGELLDIDLDKKAAGVIAARDEHHHIARLNLPLERYFASGLLLIDTNKWNELNISENAIKILAEKPPNFTMPDQDALNMLLNGQVKYLPAKWNFHEKIQTIPSDVIILHCVGFIKPWCCACDSITQTYYLNYEALSPWHKTPLELPRTYKQARIYAELLFKRQDFLKGLEWKIRYLIMKLKYILCK